MKFIDINDIEYNLRDKDVNIEREKIKQGRVYLYNFILTVYETPKKKEKYVIEHLRWGEYTFLPKELELVKEYYRFELDEMMAYYNEFLLYLFDRKQNENFVYNCKCESITIDGKEMPTGKVFDKYLKEHYSDVFSFEDLNEVKDYMNRIRKEEK